MKLILLSTPDIWAGEQAILEQLFARGLQRFHLRKPDAPFEDLREWLSRLPYELHSRIVLHQHWELIEEFSVGGLHMPEWCRKQMSAQDRHTFRQLTELADMSLSTSVHDLETLEVIQDIDDVFLSPVFPSISKKGYGPKEKLTVSKRYLFNVYALGGVQASHLPEVQARGFDGAAILGAIWQDRSNVYEAFDHVWSVAHSFEPLPFSP